MKIGDTVYLCYDGKIGRKIAGTITNKTRYKVFVEFIDNVSNQPLSGWFRRKRRTYGCTFPYVWDAYIDVENSIMKNAFGLPGDYYIMYTQTQMNRLIRHIEKTIKQFNISRILWERKNALLNI